MSEQMVSNTGPPATNKHGLANRAWNMTGLFSAIYLLGIVLGAYARRDMSIKHMPAMDDMQMVKAILIALPSAGMVMLSIFLRRYGRKYPAPGICLAGICGIAASIAILAMEWPNKMVIAYAGAPAIAVLLCSMAGSARFRKALLNVLAAFGYIFWIPRESGQVVVRAYSNVVAMYPLVITGFILGPLCDSGWVGMETAAWIWLGVAVVCVLAIMPDFGYAHTLFVVAMCVIIHLGNYALKKAYGMDPLGDLHRYLAGLNIMYDGDLRKVAFLASMFFSVLIPLSVAVTRMWRQYILKEMTTKRFKFLLGIDMVADSRRAESRYPNILRVIILLFAGDVIVQSGTNQFDVVIGNVPFLPFRISDAQAAMRTQAVREEEVQQ